MTEITITETTFDKICLEAHVCHGGDRYIVEKLVEYFDNFAEEQGRDVYSANFKRCQFFYGGVGEYCAQEAVEVVTHRDPVASAANPHIKNARWGNRNQPGQIRTELYCSPHAKEVRAYWWNIEINKKSS